MRSTARNSPASIEAIAEETTLRLVSGTTYGVRHYYYETAGFKVSDTTNLLFNNFTILSFPGMGWLLEGATKNFETSSAASVLVSCSR